MFRWLRERRQRREREARERREQLRRKAQEGGITRALQQMKHYSVASPAQPPARPPSVAEAFAAQLVINQMALDATVNGADCRHHVTQVHHGSGDNTGGSVAHHASHSSHSSHDYSSPSHSSSHDSGSSYDSGSSSSGSDSSW